MIMIEMIMIELRVIALPSNAGERVSCLLPGAGWVGVAKAVVPLLVLCVVLGGGQAGGQAGLQVGHVTHCCHTVSSTYWSHWSHRSYWSYWSSWS